MNLNQNRPCKDCGTLVVGRMLRCLACNTALLAHGEELIGKRARSRQ